MMDYSDDLNFISYPSDDDIITDKSSDDESDDTIQNLMRKLYYNRLDDDLIPNSDIKLIVGPKTGPIKSFSCHKFVLSIRSPAFQAMFNGGFLEKDEVRIIDLNPQGVENLLRFMYCDEIIDVYDDSFSDTYLAADKYLVNKLKNKLLNLIEKDLSIDNAAKVYNELLKLDIVLDNSTLIQVNDFINLHAELIFQSESFLLIDKDTLINLLEKDTLIIKEYDLFKSVLRWIEHQLKLNKQELNFDNQLMLFNSIKEYIRFQLMTKEEFNKIPLNLFTTNEINELNQFFNNKSNQFSGDLNLKKRNKLNVGKLIYDYKTNDYKMVDIHDKLYEDGNYVYLKNGIYTDDLIDNSKNESIKLNNENIDGHNIYFKNGIYADDLIDNLSHEHFLNYNMHDEDNFCAHIDYEEEFNKNLQKKVESKINLKNKNSILIYKISRTTGNSLFEKGMSIRFGKAEISFSRNGQDIFKEPVRIRLNEIISASIDVHPSYYYRIGYSKLRLEKIFDDDANLDVTLSSQDYKDGSPFAWEIYFMY